MDKHGKGDYVSISCNYNCLLCPVLLFHFYFKKLNYQSGFLLPSRKGNSSDPNNPLAYASALRDLRKCLVFAGIGSAHIPSHLCSSGRISICETLIVTRCLSPYEGSPSVDIFRRSGAKGCLDYACTTGFMHPQPTLPNC